MNMKNPTKFYLVSLGCAKNLVDSESMAQLLAKAGYIQTAHAEQADLLIVNTCGFIEPAKDESLQVLNELAKHKRKGQFLIAAGCLTQRYGVDVAQQAAGIDGILGTRRWNDIVKVAQRLGAAKQTEPVYHLPTDAALEMDEPAVLRAAVQGSSAYLKIADGCRRQCAFCAIPLIKGSAVSRPMNAIVEEARLLQARGVKELILIAQDTTDYGHDLGMKDGLATLLENLVREAPEIPWIRIMYAYPGYVTDRLIEVMASRPQILPYLDMPLQHAHPATLRRMNRPANLGWIRRALEKIRAAMPSVALRTTFIVGYPGETEEEFETLLDFVSEIRFDRVGAFKFSFEQGTPSQPLGDPISPELKQARWERLMELQQGISLAKNQAFIGQTLQVLVEGQADLQNEEQPKRNLGKLCVGRSYRDAPEIDGVVLIEEDLPVGSLAPVRINAAMPYDLSGVYQPEGRLLIEKHPKRLVG